MVLSNRLGWIGVDIGTHTVKLAQAVRTPDGLRLRHAAVIQRPLSWTDADNLSLDVPSQSATEIAAALECGDFAGRDAVCLLPMNVCELRGLNVPGGDDHERRAMIANELADEWADRPAPMEYDFWELGVDKASENLDGFNVNVLSASRPWISQVAQDCRKAHLDCWAVDGGPLAIARAVGQATKTHGGQRVLGLDWGFSNTTLCVVGNDRPVYARRIHDCGFRKCLDSVQKKFGVTLDQAQGLVDLHGIAVGEISDPGQREIQEAITEALAETVASLVEQVQRTLKFIESQRRNPRPQLLCLMGGGASVRNMSQYLSEALSLPVQTWSVDYDPQADPMAQIGPTALFGEAFALSTLAWGAA